MIAERLRVFAQPLVENLGFVYWGAEYLSSEALLRVYIDAEQGISVDDCAAVSRELSVVLDVEDVVPNQYRLEVSSPGMRRRFFSLEQFDDFIGFQVKLKLRFPFEGRRNFRGIVSKVDKDEGELGLVIEDEEYLLPYEQVDKATLIAEFDDSAAQKDEVK